MSPLSSRPALRLVVAVLAAMSVSACGGADNDGDQGDTRGDMAAVKRLPEASRATIEPAG